jgi:hypothetical protein
MQIENWDIINVRRLPGWQSFRASPAGYVLSHSIQRNLEKTPIGNPYLVNHTSIHFDGQVYEINGRGLERHTLLNYLEHPHKQFFIRRFCNMAIFDHANALALLRQIENHQSANQIKYDWLLLPRILFHIKKDGLANLTHHIGGMSFICSEFVQCLLEAGLHYSIMNRILLPNDFQQGPIFNEVT